MIFVLGMTFYAIASVTLALFLGQFINTNNRVKETR